MTCEEIAENLADLTLGLDDTFRFHCTQCGKCCTYREDILLSPMDIFRMARELGITSNQFCEKYCNSYIGDTSRIPIVRLNSVGKDARCPLLKNNKCIVHSVKPAVCALFPLGRYLEAEDGSGPEKYTVKREIKYLLQPPDCGDARETHTVREWLGSFQNSMEDEVFIRWHETVADVGNKIRKLEKKLTPMELMALWMSVRSRLYLTYDSAKDFLPQFEDNYAVITEALEKLFKAKGVQTNAAG